MVGIVVDLTTAVERIASHVILTMLRLGTIQASARIAIILALDGRMRPSTMQALRIVDPATQVMRLPTIIQGNVQIAMS